MSFIDAIFAPFFVVFYTAFCLVKRSKKAQILILLVASLVFYGWWDIRYLPLLIATSGVDYCAGLWMCQTRLVKFRKVILIGALLINLSILAYFKYSGFFIASTERLIGLFGLEVSRQYVALVLPVGISFYTFQSMSYSLDVYSGRIKPERSLTRFMLFVTFFPQLVAGPIVRAGEFLEQLKSNFIEKADHAGVAYIAYGLWKKMFLADLIGPRMVDPVFARPNQYNAVDLFVSMYAFAFQIFCDFSAYSDIAIGLGKLFGLELPINFRAPYLARNPQEFWTRWHITLSTWLRDYIYIPLGGSRMGRLITLRNIFATLLLGGIWHGAGWHFVIWGLIHAVYLAGHRMWVRLVRWRMPDWMSILICFHLICFALIIFRAPSISRSAEYILGMGDWSGLSAPFQWPRLLTPMNTIILTLALASHIVIEPRLAHIINRVSKWHWVVQGLCLYTLFVMISYYQGLNTMNRAFIYFQF